MNQYLLQIEGSLYYPTPGLLLKGRVKSNLELLLIAGPLERPEKKSDDF